MGRRALCAATVLCVVGSVGLAVIYWSVMQPARPIIELPKWRGWTLQQVTSELGDTYTVETVQFTDSDPSDQLRLGVRLLLRDRGLLDKPVIVEELWFDNYGDFMTVVWMYEGKVIDAVKFHRDVNF